MALLAALIGAIVTSNRLRPKAPVVQDPRVVVLPFQNIGGLPENDRHCRVLADLLAARLALLPEVKVVSSRSLGPLSSDQITPEFLRDKLRVDYAVRGSLLQSDSQLQVTFRLIQVANGNLAWTESSTGSWAEIAGRVDELAERFANTMGLAVKKGEGQANRLPSTNVAAYDAWMKGRFSATEYWNTLLPSHYEDAERRLNRALMLEPEYVDAMVDLAQLYQSAAYPPNGNQVYLLEKAEKLATSAVTLNPDSGSAHGVLGGIYTDTGRPRVAMPHLLRAAQLSPQDPMPHNGLSIAYEAMGFWESSLFEREEAVKRDPLLKGISLGSYRLLAWLGRLPEAFRTEESAGEVTPWMAYLYLVTGEPKRAETILLRAKPRDPAEANEFGVSLALAQAMQGRPAIAKSAIKEFATTERTRNERFILLCAIAGEKALLVDEIAKHAYRREYRWVTSEPLLRPYRDYAPFRKLLRELHREWQGNLTEVGPSLPIRPPNLPDVEEYLSQR